MAGRTRKQKPVDEEPESDFAQRINEMLESDSESSNEEPNQPEVQTPKASTRKQTTEKGNRTMAQTAESRPEYELEAVDELPEEEPAATRGQALLFHRLLEPLANDVDQWYQVAHYKTPTGAGNAAKEIDEGKRILPELDEGFAYEFAARKIKNPVDPNGKRHSILFGRVVKAA